MNKQVTWALPEVTVVDCPFCGKEATLAISETRPAPANGKWAIRRRRACEKCGKRFTTYEITNDDMRHFIATEHWFRVTAALFTGRDIENHGNLPEDDDPPPKK